MNWLRDGGNRRDLWQLVVTGVVFWALWLAFEAVAEIKDSRRNGIVISCHEANARHKKAIPQIVALIRNGEATAPRAQREAQEEAITALIGGPTTGGVNGTYKPGPAPRTAAGRLALAQTNAFIDIIAPAYDCAQRVKEFTKA